MRIWNKVNVLINETPISLWCCRRSYIVSHYEERCPKSSCHVTPECYTWALHIWRLWRIKFYDGPSCCLGRLTQQQLSSCVSLIVARVINKKNEGYLVQFQMAALAYTWNGGVFHITNEMQLIQCSLLLSTLYMFRSFLPPIIRSL
jgi:hypothetical protein